MAVANGSPYYMAPALLRSFEEELAPIMLFFANNSDYIIKEKEVSEIFLNQLFQFELPVPQFISSEKLNSSHITETSTTLKAESWGNSPAESNFIKNLKISTIPGWTPEIKLLFERESSRIFLQDLLNSNRFDPFPSPDETPKRVSSPIEIEELINHWGQIVIKSPLSSSGRGLQIIRKQEINQSIRQWIKTMLKQQHYLIVEKWYNKTEDVSFLFHVDENQQVNYLGPSFFTTNSNGQYLGHNLQMPRNANHQITDSIINEVGNILCKSLQQSIFSKQHQGYIGIDGIIYKDGANTKIHPCLEINPRYTMGILSKFIEQKIHPESIGLFRTYYHPKRPFSDFIEEQTKKNPPVNADNQFFRGFLPITSPDRESKFGAWIELL